LPVIDQLQRPSLTKEEIDVAHVEVDPDAVAGTASRIAAAAHLPTAPTVTICPAASDPVSTAVAQTFAARMDGIAGYTAAARAITDHRATMLAANGSDYRQQEAANTAALTGGSAPAALTPQQLADGLAALPASNVVPSSIGAPPASGKAIAQLINSGDGAAGLYAAAAQIRRHGADLSARADRLRANAHSIAGDWDSAAGREASSRVTELGAWYESHAARARSLAAAVETHGDNYGRARAAVPSPQRFDDAERRLQVAIAANSAPGSIGRYTPVIAALQTELVQLNGEAIQAYAHYAITATDPSITGDPLQPPPHPAVQAVGYDVPLTPPPADPPHGKDPRYWIDVTRIIHVPDGQLAPSGTVQIGPGLYYPEPGSNFTYAPPPPPAKYPLDTGDIVSTAPGQLGPSGHELIAQTPHGSYWAPDPNAGYQPAPPWTAPQQPIDARDVINVPSGQLAPWGYVEYLPEWFMPGPQLTNTPTSPQAR
jgi:hypothetical protein